MFFSQFQQMRSIGLISLRSGMQERSPFWAKATGIIY